MGFLTCFSNRGNVEFSRCMYDQRSFSSLAKSVFTRSPAHPLRTMHFPPSFDFGAFVNPSPRRPRRPFSSSWHLHKTDFHFKSPLSPFSLRAFLSPREIANLPLWFALSKAREEGRILLFEIPFEVRGFPCSSSILPLTKWYSYIVGLRSGGAVYKGVRGIKPSSLELLETIVINFKH